MQGARVRHGEACEGSRRGRARSGRRRVALHARADLLTCVHRDSCVFTQVQHVLDERAMLARVAGYPFLINLLTSFQVRR